MFLSNVRPHQPNSLSEALICLSFTRNYDAMSLKLRVRSDLRSLVDKLSRIVDVLVSRTPPTILPQTLFASDATETNLLLSDSSLNQPYLFTVPTVHYSYRLLFIKAVANVRMTKTADIAATQNQIQVTISTDEDGVNQGIFNFRAPTNALTNTNVQYEFQFTIAIPGDRPSGSGVIRCQLSYQSSGGNLSLAQGSSQLTSQIMFLP
jgi:hypothetical protein